MDSAETARAFDLDRFPSTRYRGSKRKLAHRLLEELLKIEFDSAIDLFGGTGVVSWCLKSVGKRVIYNDVLRFNEQVGIALLANDRTTVPEDAADDLGAARAGRDYDDFIARTFDGVYFTSDENRYLDIAAQNIAAETDAFRRGVLWFALGQAAIAKRPYNLFHRKNLYMRGADVPRSFGNKATWDTPFPVLVRRFLGEANRAILPGRAAAIRGEAHECAEQADLLYLDPPYISAKGRADDYADFYHFLDGMIDYTDWAGRVDRRRKHLPLVRFENPWLDPSSVEAAYEQVLTRHERSAIALSYRSDGKPSIDRLRELLLRFKPRVQMIELARYQYALSTNSKSAEVLLVAR